MSNPTNNDHILLQLMDEAKAEVEALVRRTTPYEDTAYVHVKMAPLACALIAVKVAWDIRSIDASERTLVTRLHAISNDYVFFETLVGYALSIGYAKALADKWTLSRIDAALDKGPAQT